MLNDEQCDKIAATLGTNGWREVFIPVISQRGQAGIKALCTSLEERDGIWKNKSDEYIRGALSVYEYVLSAFQNEVTVNRGNRQREQANGEGVANQGQALTP